MTIFKKYFRTYLGRLGIDCFYCHLIDRYYSYIAYLFYKRTKRHRNISKNFESMDGGVFNLHWLPVKNKRQTYFKKGETYVVVCNHNSLMDVPVTTPFVPGANKTIAKKSMAKTPLFGWVYTRGSVLVDRDSDESRRQSFEAMKQTLADGLHMVIYPEGTRNRTNDPLKPFYDGAFKLAVATKKNIIPTLLFNTNKVLPTHKTFFFWPHTLEMHFLPVIETANIPVKELKEKVFKIMWDYYKQHA